MVLSNPLLLPVPSPSPTSPTFPPHPLFHAHAQDTQRHVLRRLLLYSDDPEKLMEKRAHKRWKKRVGAMPTVLLGDVLADLEPLGSSSCAPVRVNGYRGCGSDRGTRREDA
jgi:hypothetical protein